MDESLNMYLGNFSQLSGVPFGVISNQLPSVATVHGTWASVIVVLLLAALETMLAALSQWHLHNSYIVLQLPSLHGRLLHMPDMSLPIGEFR